MNSAATEFATPDDGRQYPRTHLFVIATLYAEDSGSAPVHVRNMSPSGALIESSALPEPGTRVKLKRGSLQANGRIAWSSDRRAGVTFSSAVHVSDWMSRQSGPQGQVDNIVANYKAGDRPCGDMGTGANGLRETPTIQAELAMLRAELAQLGNSLIGDAILVATHPEIQILDISLQRIDRLTGRL